MSSSSVVTPMRNAFANDASVFSGIRPRPPRCACRSSALDSTLIDNSRVQSSRATEAAVLLRCASSLLCGERRVDPGVAVAVDGIEQPERVAVRLQELAPQVEEDVAELCAGEEAVEESLRPLRREQGRRLALRADDAARALGHEVGNEAVVERRRQLGGLAGVDE